LTRHFLAESLILAFTAGVAGWALAGLLTKALLKMLGQDAEGLGGLVQPDGAALGFAFLAAAGCGIAFGLWPAWKAAQSDPLRAIRGLDAPRGKAFGSRLLVSAQIALSVTLLFGCGLFVRTLRNLRAIDLGFRPENIALLDLDLSRLTSAQSATYLDDLLRRARSLPETRAASLSRISVLSGAMQSAALRIPGYVSRNGMNPTSYITTVSDGYFRTLGTPMSAGRDFTMEDRAAGGKEFAAIVNEKFAQQFLGGDALGKTFAFAGGFTGHVVGVVKNTHFRRLREKEEPILYTALAQDKAPNQMYLQVRTSGDPSLVTRKLRAAVREIDSRASLDSVTTMEAQIDDALRRERLLAFLSTVIGALAVALAAIGLYGVVSYSVARRMREIGIRLAVGASRGEIFVQFVRESFYMAAAGIAAGVPLALALGRLATAFLYGLTGQDMMTAATACGALAITALCAATIPAIRAARLDPMQSLRRE
jgi:predicted permease